MTSEDREEKSDDEKKHISFSVFLLSCDHLTYLQMCLGHSPLLQHTQTEQVTSGTGSSHSSD